MKFLTLLSHSLIDYLSTEAVEHGKVVADFTQSLAVYEDFKPDQVEDENTGLAYDKAVESMKEWYSAQMHGFTYLEDHCGFWLNNKQVNADSRDEIIKYFTDTVPVVTSEIETVLQV
jgi:hypothetical protein